MKNIKAAMAIQVLPRVAETEELIKVVDKVIENIQSKGLEFQVSAFETTIDGDLDILLQIIKESLEICIKEGAPSVMSYIKINYSPQGVLSIDEKTGKYKKGSY